MKRIPPPPKDTPHVAPYRRPVANSSSSSTDNNRRLNAHLSSSGRRFQMGGESASASDETETLQSSYHSVDSEEATACMANITASDTDTIDNDSTPGRVKTTSNGRGVLSSETDRTAAVTPPAIAPENADSDGEEEKKDNEGDDHQMTPLRQRQQVNPPFAPPLVETVDSSSSSDSGIMLPRPRRGHRARLQPPKSLQAVSSAATTETDTSNISNVTQASTSTSYQTAMTPTSTSNLITSTTPTSTTTPTTSTSGSSVTLNPYMQQDDQKPAPLHVIPPSPPESESVEQHYEEEEKSEMEGQDYDEERASEGNTSSFAIPEFYRENGATATTLATGIALADATETTSRTNSSDQSFTSSSDEEEPTTTDQWSVSSTDALESGTALAANRTASQLVLPLHGVDPRDRPSSLQVTSTATEPRNSVRFGEVHQDNTKSGYLDLGNNIDSNSNGNSDDNDDLLSLTTLQQNQHENDKRRQGRRLGCYMFVVGLVAVLVAVILVTYKLVVNTDNNNNNATIPSHTENDNEEAFIDSSVLLEWLDLPLVTLDAMEADDESPQAQAFEWLRHDPHWTLTKQHSTSGIHEDQYIDMYYYSPPRARQRMGLATLYFATQGKDWNSGPDLDGNSAAPYFLSYDHHECDWLRHIPAYGCYSSLHDHDERGEFLTSLALPDMGLDGTLPPELYWLVSPSTLKSIDLSQNRITGTIGTQIGVLRNLERLDFSQNDLTGSVPSEVGSCLGLAILSLNFNPRLGGTIPSEIGSLKSLQGLWWRDTSVQGPIPSEVGLLRYSLSLLDLTGNHLTSTIPVELFVGKVGANDDTTSSSASARSSSVVANATVENEDSATGSMALEELRLARNRLSGTIPTAIENLKSSLKALVLSQNQFDMASLPTILAALTKLTSLQISSSQWTGEIPSELGLLTDLNSLGMSENQFTGSIPTSLGELTHLQSLYLNDNQNLKGHLGLQTVEDGANAGLDLTRLSDLRELTITSTSISGFLEPTLCEMAILSFDCDPYNLCGCDCQCSSAAAPTTTPTTSSPSASPTVTPVTDSPTRSPTVAATQRPTTSLTEAPTNAATISLEELEVAFIEQLPLYSQVGLQDPQGAQVKALEWLFSGPSVRDYSNDRRNQRFALATIHYSSYDTSSVSWLAPETDECAQFAQLKINVLCTENEESESGIRSVKDITLDPSGLIGSLPPEIALLSSLVSVGATQSNLTSTLPSEIGLLQNLEKLDLSQNKLLGPLPSEIGECMALTSLNVGFNQNMNGTLPTELKSLSSLKALKLASNKFVGRLPEEFPSSLKVLEASANLFYNTIPLASWGQSALSENLERLHLGHNPLQGSLATEIGLFSRMTSLDVAKSLLTGSLPTQTGLLSQLRLLDASQNRIGSTIPTEIGQLSMLRALRLDNLQFRGSIPTQVGTMVRLEELILHDNDMIGGRIPQELTSLAFLNVLTVNKTFVAGRVPSRLCLLDHFNFTCSEWLCGCSWCPCSG